MVELVLLQVQSLITGDLAKEKGKVRSAIRGVQKGFPVEAYSSAPDLSAGTLSGQPEGLVVKLLCIGSSCVYLLVG